MFVFIWWGWPEILQSQQFYTNCLCAKSGGVAPTTYQACLLQLGQKIMDELYQILCSRKSSTRPMYNVGVGVQWVEINPEPSFLFSSFFRFSKFPNNFLNFLKGEFSVKYPRLKSCVPNFPHPSFH